MNINKYDSIIILGPTASGKTNISLSLAKTLNGEIINADSMQIYKFFNIGTAKPTPNELQTVNHHLFDFVNPNDEFSVSDYRQFAEKKIDELKNKNIIPIFVGGTGFYINSLITNYSYGQSEKNDKIREKYNQILNEKGPEYLHNLLKDVDYESSLKIHQNDTKRVIRALEIFETTGKKKSEVQNLEIKQNINPLIIGLTYPREMLYERINLRVDQMIQDGLVEEVQSLYKEFSINSQAFKGIGYKEFIPYFENKITLEEVKESIKMNTRRYAKRQLTWFRKTPNVNWYDKSIYSEEEIITDIISKFNS